MIFFIFEDKSSNNQNIQPIFKLKGLKFERDELNIKDFKAQNVIFCLHEGYRRLALSNINL